jgi:mono/diheme cytochrome c family protein
MRAQGRPSFNNEEDNMHLRLCRVVLCGSVLVLLAISVGFGYQEKKAGPAASAQSAGTAAKPKAAAKVASGEKQGPLIAQGKNRFQAYKCYDCHGKNGEGTDDAPDLTHSKLTAEQVSKFLQKPSADAQNKGMPDIPVDSPDHKPLVAYVMSLRAK